MKEVSRVYNEPRVWMERSVMTAARPINICRHEYLNFRFKLCDILVVPSQFQVKLFRVLCIRLQLFRRVTLESSKRIILLITCYRQRRNVLSLIKSTLRPSYLQNSIYFTLRTLKCHKINECKERLAYSSTINLNLGTVEVAAIVCR